MSFVSLDLMLTFLAGHFAARSLKTNRLKMPNCERRTSDQVNTRVVLLGR
jgi:hypothetical protein